ncbi:MAG TPA: hypothetical protein VF590_20775 [Isosphaeraceae bacterium]|jgi:hypothetical protein
MRRLLWAAWLGGVGVFLASAPAPAQFVDGAMAPYPVAPAYAAPGSYGVGFGVPSFGLTRTYSAYSSSYGLGYGYGYPPYSYLPGRYGVGLWWPGFVSPGYVYGASYYRTFPVPYRPLVPSVGPPLGYYAPGFGPPASIGW